MNEEEIERLLQDGLTLYGYGKVEEAVAVWRKVLELEPQNRRAIDYIETAGYSPESPGVTPASPEPVKLEQQSTEFINLNYIRELLKSRRFELAYEFLNKLYEKHYPSNKLITAYLAIVKAQMIKLYYEELYSFSGIPKLNINEQELVRYNLDKADGYLISMIDGYSTLEEIFQMISTMDRFETIKRFYKLKKLGVIGF